MPGDAPALKTQFERTHLNFQFIRAAQDGDLARMKELRVEGASINAMGQKGRNALNWAAERGDGIMVEWLLAEKIFAEHPDDNGDTPLHLAARSKSDNCVKAISQAVKTHDAKNALGETPAVLAVAYGTTVIMETILRAGASPNQRDPDGNPLIVTAGALQAEDKVEMLLSLGANPGLSGCRGKSLELTDTVISRYSLKVSEGTQKPLQKRKSVSFD